AGLAVVEELTEHLDARDGGLGGLLLDADELDILVHVDLATLDTTGDDGAATGDREDVLDGHEERLVRLTLRVRDGLVARLHEVDDGLNPLLLALERLE